MFGLSLIAFCCSCADGVPASAEQYLTRLAWVLDDVPSEMEPEQLTPFPRKRELTLGIVAKQLDWIEFGQLHRCDLGDLAGYRNSSLGRVMRPLNLLAYELRWLQAADHCLAQEPSTSSDLKVNELLNEIKRGKRSNLPRHYWNAVIAGEAMRQWMGRTSGATAGNASQALAVLGDQARNLPEHRTDIEQVSSALLALSTAPRAGAARARWAEMRWVLGAAAGLLRKHSRRVCRNRQPTPTARRLKTVFRMFYGQQLQPEYAVQVGRDVQWVSAYAQVVRLIKVDQPAAHARWYAQVLDQMSAESEWQRTQNAFKAHASAWNELATGCGLSLFE